MARISTLIRDDEIFEVPEFTKAIRLFVRWKIKETVKSNTELDMEIYIYNERAHLIEKVDAAKPVSKGEGCKFVSAELLGESEVNVKVFDINFDAMRPSVTALLFVLDGGARNFQNIESFTVAGIQLPSGNEAYFSSDHEKYSLFKVETVTRREYHTLAFLSVFRQKVAETSVNPKWGVKQVSEPIALLGAKGKAEMCEKAVIAATPMFESFRPKLFPTVHDICSCLTSLDLPKLSNKFHKFGESIGLKEFSLFVMTELFLVNAHVLHETEAGHTISLIEKTFNQIDIKGTGVIKWNDFTSFCIDVGLADVGVERSDALIVARQVVSTKRHDASTKADRHQICLTLDEYSIGYSESIARRDQFLTAHRPVRSVKLLSEIGRLVLIQEESSYAILTDLQFRVISQLHPSKITNPQFSDSETPQFSAAEINNSLRARVLLLDIIYLPLPTDLYVFSSSDHSITVCKEKRIGGISATDYLYHNKIEHDIQHLKLCWSEKNKVLCSVAADNVIYGWDISKASPIFLLNRHKDIITDLIAVDKFDLFITCSMDRRIVLWSSQNRCVKAVLQGHDTGVRCISTHENILLSIGFECEAKTWDMMSQETTGILRGHRRPITAGQLMCKAAETELDHRAVTVDEAGEFRLWNICAGEKQGNIFYYSTLQIFEMENPESSMLHFRWLALPYDSVHSTGYYSNLLACSSKLMHFIPERNTRNFVTPTCVIFNESASSIMTSFGRSLATYDVSNGKFVHTFSDFCKSEVSALLMCDEHGGRLYVGCASGDLLLLNFYTGVVLDEACHLHHKEITSIVAHHDRDRNFVYTSSIDGRIRLTEEKGGKFFVTIHVCDNAFGQGVGIADLRDIPNIDAVVARASGSSWGVWDNKYIKNIGTVKESGFVHAISIIAAIDNTRGRSEDEKSGVVVAAIANNNKQTTTHRNRPDSDPTSRTQRSNFVVGGRRDGRNVNVITKEKLLTIAVALSFGVHIYTMDVHNFRGAVSHELLHHKYVYITQLCALRPTVDDKRSGGLRIVACTDEGRLIVWDAKKLVEKSVAIFREKYSIQAHSKRRSTHRGVSSEPEKPTRRRNSILMNFMSLQPGEFASSIQAFLTETDMLESSAETYSAPKFLQTVHSYEMLPRVVHKCMSDAHWRAHNDSIVAILSLTYMSSFLTVSLDGYHRIWNAYGNLLGVLPLPNLSEVLLDPVRKLALQHKGETESWGVYIEKNPIMKRHQDLARDITRSIDDSDLGKRHKITKNLLGGQLYEALATAMLDEKDLPKTGSLVTTKPGDGSNFANMTPAEQTRIHALQSLADDYTKSSESAPTLSHSGEAITGSLSSTRRSRNSVGGLGNSLDASSTASGVSDFNHRLAASSSSSSPGGADTIGALSNNVSPLRTSPTRYTPKKSMLLPQWVTGDVMAKARGGTQQLHTTAFSPQSLADSTVSGLFGAEERKILHQLANEPEKIRAYNRVEPLVLLRNPELATNVQLPRLRDISGAELRFGEQKDFYKNASKTLSVTSATIQSGMLQSIVKARIRHRVRQVGSMIKILHTDSYADVTIPQREEPVNAKNITEDIVHKALYKPPSPKKFHSSKSAHSLKETSTGGTGSVGGSVASTIDEIAIIDESPSLDVSRLEKLVERVDVAIAGADPKTYRMYRSPLKFGGSKNTSFSAQYLASIEIALKIAIEETRQWNIDMAMRRRAAMDNGFDSVEDECDEQKNSSVTLSTRDLLPYYRLSDVIDLCKVIRNADSGRSGEFGIEEWVDLFRSLDAQAMSANQARMLFHSIDRDNNRSVSVIELVPLLFSKANRQQMKLILEYVKSQLIVKPKNVRLMKLRELGVLFEAYDVGGIGYVKVSYVIERMGKLLNLDNLSELKEVFSEFDFDDLLNRDDFVRSLKRYAI